MPVDYQTFAPKILAGISSQRPPLHSTTPDRTIRIELQRRRRDEAVEQFRRLREVEETQSLQAELAELGRQHFDEFCDLDPEPPPNVDDRAGELWTPLLAVAEIAGGTWPKKKVRAATAILSARRSDDDEAVALLLDL